jgi:hypothetical protein
MKVISHLDNMSWDSIKRVVTLLKFIEKQYDNNTMRTVKGRITKVYDSTMSPHRYNNAINELLVTLKQEYPHQEVDGELKAFNPEAFVSQLSVADEAKLLVLLAERAGLNLEDISEVA